MEKSNTLFIDPWGNLIVPDKPKRVVYIISGVGYTNLLSKDFYSTKHLL